MSSLQLEPDRALPFPAEQRSIAREIYAETKDLPLICMHGHMEPEVLAGDSPFADPAQLLIVPDHYVFRMLASQGIEPARLGVPRIDGGPVEADSRTIWRTFCENLRFHMPVHANQRQVFHLGIDFPGDAPLLGRKRESPVGLELEG